MGLFERLKRRKLSYGEFEQWLDAALENEMTSEVIAFNFNIYEDADNQWSIEVVGTASFDESGEDWACDEVTNLGTRNKPFT